jgi:hypothetical protein
MQSPAGWHPDPTGRYEFRYFNGQRWTSDVAVDGRHFVDVAGQSLPGSTGGLAPRQPAIRGFALASFWVALGSVLSGWMPFVFVIAACGAFTAMVFGIIALRRSSRSDTDRTRHGRPYAIAGLVLALLAVGTSVIGFMLTRAVLRDVDRFANPGEFDVEITSCSAENRLLTVTGTITNLSDDTRSYVVTIRLDAAGNDLGDVTAEIDDVAPGAEEPFTATEFVRPSQPVTCEIDDVTGPIPFDLG